VQSDKLEAFIYVIFAFEHKVQNNVATNMQPNKPIEPHKECIKRYKNIMVLIASGSSNNKISVLNRSKFTHTEPSRLGHVMLTTMNLNSHGQK